MSYDDKNRLDTLVNLEIEGTGADYAAVSESLLDRERTEREGVRIGNVMFRGRIRGLGADLLSQDSEDPNEWKWRMYIGLLPNKNVEKT